jgi:UDP-N-acetylglucosamine pyrophosphorylase
MKREMKGGIQVNKKKKCKVKVYSKVEGIQRRSITKANGKTPVEAEWYLPSADRCTSRQEESMPTSIKAKSNPKSQKNNQSQQQQKTRRYTKKKTKPPP